MEYCLCFASEVTNQYSPLIQHEHTADTVWEGHSRLEMFQIWIQSRCTCLHAKLRSSFHVCQDRRGKNDTNSSAGKSIGFIMHPEKKTYPPSVHLYLFRGTLNKRHNIFWLHLYWQSNQFGPERGKNSNKTSPSKSRGTIIISEKTYTKTRKVFNSSAASIPTNTLWPVTID